MKTSIAGYHLRDRLDLKEIKNNLAINCIYADPTELMYQGEDSKQKVYLNLLFFRKNANALRSY